ncbi:MAG: TRAP transporter small permease [Betaproteobacteria bacterium]|nr:TRAP transporter small permease [Betaproteobacteria bacterium]
MTVWLDRVSWALDRASAYVVLPVMTVIMLMEVIGRYVFNSPFIWSLEATNHLLVIVLLFGIPECTRTNGHIRMDLLNRRMPDRARRAVEVLYALIGIMVFVLIAKKAGSEIEYLKSIPVITEFLLLPIWIYYTGIVLLSAMMVLMFALRVVRAVRAPQWDAETH